MALRPTRPQSRNEQLAERDAAQQDGFLREVDEALRQDEMVGAFKRYGKSVGVLIVAGLLGLAGWLWWTDHQKAARAERAETFVLALDQVEGGQLDAGYKALDPLAQQGGDGSQAAARMLQAGIALEQGRKSEAVKLLSAVAGDSAAAQPYRDLALVRQVAVEFDTMRPDDVVGKLKTLATPGNPWFASAAELVGMAYLKQGKNDLAGPLFAAISRDKDASDSARSRARQMAGLLGVDAIDDPGKAAAMPQAAPAAPGQ